jgi:hypothetical protein
MNTIAHAPAVMDLVAGYGAYSDAPELNLQAAADAPATTPVCISISALTALTATGITPLTTV